MGQEGELERRQGIRWKRCVEDASFYLLGQSCVRFTPWVQSLDEFSEQTHSQACPSDVILGNGGELPNVMEAQVALVVKNLPTNIGDVRDSDSIPGSGRSPGRGHGNPLQYSCLENPMDRGAWRAAVHGVTESGMTERLSVHARCCTIVTIKCDEGPAEHCPV